MSTATDPLAAAIEAAEDAALAHVGPRFTSWAAVEEWAMAVVTHPEWNELFPDAPIDVAVQRRSRSARYAAAEVPSATIAVPDGSWFPFVVLHELAHLAGPDDPPHGGRFLAAELQLVRRFLGVEAWAAYREALVAEGVVA